jgi:hypothetical protein
MYSPPSWLQQFADRAAQSLTPLVEASPVGCHWHLSGGRWELTLFVSAFEIVGGERDGQRIPCPLEVDVMELLSLYNAIHECRWQPLDLHGDDEVGPHLSILGVVDGKDVWLRVVARQPIELEAGQMLDLQEQSMQRRW